MAEAGLLTKGPCARLLGMLGVSRAATLGTETYSRPGTEVSLWLRRPRPPPSWPGVSAAPTEQGLCPGPRDACAHAHRQSAQRGMSCRTEKKIDVLRKYSLSLLVIIFLENVCVFVYTLL